MARRNVAKAKKKVVEKVVKPLYVNEVKPKVVEKSTDGFESCLEKELLAGLEELRLKSMNAYDDWYNSGINASIDKIKAICGKK